MKNFLKILKDLISTFALTLFKGIFKGNLSLYFHDIYGQPGQNQAKVRSSALKLKHPLRDMCSGDIFAY